MIIFEPTKFFIWIFQIKVKKVRNLPKLQKEVRNRNKKTHKTVLIDNKVFVVFDSQIKNWSWIMWEYNLVFRRKSHNKLYFIH